MPNGSIHEKSLGELCHLISRGRQPTYVENSDVLAIGQRCVRDGRFLAENARRHDADALTGHLSPEKGDVLLNRYRHRDDWTNSNI